MKKLEGADKVRVDQFLTQIFEKLGTGSLPRRLSLEKQGIFILGYYHQRQKWYEKKEEK